MKSSRMLLAVALVSFAGTSIAAHRNFETTLNRCMTQPGATVMECARVAGIAADSKRVDVKYSLDLGTGRPSSTSGEVYDCAGNICAVYDCSEDEDAGQSTCDWVANVCYNESDC